MSTYPQFMLFGDSLLELSDVDFAGPLQAKFSRRLDVVNRGLSGYTSSLAVEVLPEIIPSSSTADIAYLLILFGANDACTPENPSEQHVPLELYKKNIRTLLSHPRVQEHSPRIILVSPPPIEETLCEAKDISNGSQLGRRAERTAEYAQAIRNLHDSGDDKLLVFDLWTAFMGYANRNTASTSQNGLMLGSRELGGNDALIGLLADGLHLTSDGYTLFLSELLKAIHVKWPSDGPESLKYILPEWRTMLGLPPKKTAL